MKVISFDIETVVNKDYNDLTEQELSVWKARTKNRFKHNEIYEDEHSNYSEKFENNGAFYPEFASVVCISAYFKENGQNVAKSFICTEKTNIENEKTILINFANELEKQDPTHLLGHNIKAFDIPFLVKKYMQHSLCCPPILRASFGKLKKFEIVTQKPWELKIYIDTMEIFKSTSKEYYSLDAICLFLGIETPKKIMKGSDVGEYYKAGEIDKIARYCEANCKTVTEIYIKFINFLNK